MTGRVKLPYVIVEIRCEENHVHRRQGPPSWLRKLADRPRCPVCHKPSSVRTLGNALNKTGWTPIVPSQDELSWNDRGESTGRGKPGRPRKEVSDAR